MKWEASHIAGSDGPAIFRKDGEKNVRLFNAVEATPEEIALASAAPELMEALRLALKWHRRIRTQIFGTDVHEEMIRAAIARAEGGE